MINATPKNGPSLRDYISNVINFRNKIETTIDVSSWHRCSGVAKPGPTRALARASAHLALASEIGDNHMINLYSLQSMV